jgi:tryptophan-rich sensory protein
LLGQYFTGHGMQWYATLQLPNFTPSGWFIWIVWTTIFILGALSVILFCSRAEHDKKFGIAITLFIDNAILNVLRTWLFFVKHLFLWSIIEMILLWIVTVILIIAVWPRSKWSSLLLIPYAIWLIVATYLAIGICILN